MRRLRSYPNADAAWRDVIQIKTARERLKDARDYLSMANARNAKRAVSRALKSVEGAERHANRIYLALYYDQRRKEGTA